MIRLTNEQWERIRDHFPEEHIADGRPGRKPIASRRVLEAVLWILNTGAQWRMLPQSYPNYKTVHRRFQAWCRDETLRRILTDVANDLRDRGVLDEEECFIDATFVMAKGGGAEIGPTKRGKGMKIMAIVDRHGLPLSVSTHAANHHEVRLVQLCFDFYMIEAKPENLIGDRAYDSDLIAIVLQWLVALLVRLQRQHVTAMLEKAESQRRFVNVLSHEVGTALTVIGGQASRLMKLAVPQDLKLRAEKIRDAARRIELFIDRIRFASSFGDGTIPIEHGAVNLHSVLQQLTEQLREENRGRVIELGLHSEPQIVDGDEMLIRQMFENVIMNSLKYSPPDRKITINITKRNPLARITIVDHGSGMSQYDLSRVRTPFFRGENSKGISGTGIGLYVVQQIVEAHKGHIFIESALGVGTTVVLDLPQSAEVARA